MQTKIVLFLFFLYVLFYQCEDNTYRSIYGNTFLVNNPYDFCGDSSLENIYYVSSVEDKTFLGYVTPKQVLFCNESNFIIEGTFKDLYTDIKCDGVFYSYVNQDYVVAFFKTDRDDIFCKNTNIKLYKKMTIINKLYYKLEYIFNRRS